MSRFAAAADRRRRDRAVLAAVQVLALLPFLARPVHIDEAFFLAIARHILDAPLAPFDFDYNWTGTPVRVWDEMQNPPLVFYLQALLLRCGVESVAGLHALFALFPLVASQALYSLAARVARRPLEAALLVVLTPAWWVSATSLMIEMPLLAAMLLSLAAAARALECLSLRSAAVAGVAAAAALLSKYFAMALVPLLAAQVAWQARAGRASPGSRTARVRRAALLLAIFVPPLAAFALWAWLGDLHVAHAFAYRAGTRWSAPRVATQLLATASFTGGLLVFPVLAWLADFGRGETRARAGFGLVFAVAALALRFALWPLPPQPLNDLLLALMCGGAAGFALQAFARWPADDAPLRRTLLLWLAGGLAFALFFNWTVNARTVLLYAVPAALVWSWRSEERPRLRRTALALTAAVGLLVTLADAELAGFGPAEAARTRAAFGAGGARVRFVGHWGFQDAMERSGYAHLDFAHPDLRPGDVVIVPWLHRRANIGLDALPPPRSRRVRLRPRRLPIAVMSEQVGAGLHGAFLGPWPYAFTREALERVEIWQW